VALVCATIVATAAPALAGFKHHGSRRSGNAGRRGAHPKRRHARLMRHARAAARASSCGNEQLRPAADNAGAVETATLCLIDRIRAAHQLGPLRANRDLRSMAARKVGSMLRWNYFADVGPGATGLLSLIGAGSYRAHATRVSLGQNIAWGTGVQATPARIVDGWMASPPHRRIILTGSFRDAGVAAIPAVPSSYGHGEYGATYVIELGTRR
jgi:uncharacterized protein YkwD